MKTYSHFLLFLLGLSVCTAFITVDEWGFFGHRRINRMAVFTLPPEMMVFYKPNIEYITEHATDPDKRRYASKLEAVRHYMDIDHYGSAPYDNVPREWGAAFMKFSEIQIVTPRGDTLPLFSQTLTDAAQKKGAVQYVVNPRLYRGDAILPIEEGTYRDFFYQYLQPMYYDEDLSLNCELIAQLTGNNIDCEAVIWVDDFSVHGIIPYHLEAMQKKLTKAFVNLDKTAILRHSADFGHYIGDAHVPLHTTTNYNGQLTDQVGIHAFWESRIPELFADATYDYFVGKCTYIQDTRDYYWDIVLTSHSYVDSVLLIEKDLSRIIPEDQQYCYDERLGTTVSVPCRSYAAAYQARMNGMVEQRMRDAIQSIGDAWYTAWVDAGQPDLSPLLDKPIVNEEAARKALDAAYEKGNIKGREH